MDSKQETTQLSEQGETATNATTGTSGTASAPTVIISDDSLVVTKTETKTTTYSISLPKNYTTTDATNPNELTKLITSSPDDHNTYDIYDTLLTGARSLSGMSHVIHLHDNNDNFEHPILGAILYSISVTLFCIIAVIVKFYSGSVTQLLICRYAIQFFIACIVWHWLKTRDNTSQSMTSIADITHDDGDDIDNNSTSSGSYYYLLRLFQLDTNSFDINLEWYGHSNDRLWIWLRGTAYCILIYCWWRGVELVPIGTAECIIFTFPITVVIAAKLLLNESVPNSFYITAPIAIIALLLICQPKFIFKYIDNNYSYDTIDPIGFIFLIIALIAGTLEVVLIRKSKEAHWLQLELVSSLLAAFIMTPIVVIIDLFVNDDIKNILEGSDHWEFNIEFIFVCISTAILGFIALMLHVVAFGMAPAAKISFIGYLELVIGFLFQITIFNDTPNAYEIIGAILMFSICAVRMSEQYILQKRTERGETETRNEYTELPQDE